MIVVIDLSNVTVDGTPAGSIADVLLNYKGRANETLLAAKAWKQSRDNAALQDRVAALKARDESHVAVLAELQMRFDAAVSDAKATADKHAEEIARKQAEIDALGGTELALKLAAEKRRSQLLAAREAADAELKQLDAGSAEVAATDAIAANGLQL